MKIITLCGSMRFKNEMISIACELELNGDVAIQCVYFPQNKRCHLCCKCKWVYWGIYEERNRICSFIK